MKINILVSNWEWDIHMSHVLNGTLITLYFFRHSYSADEKIGNKQLYETSVHKESKIRTVNFLPDCEKFYTVSADINMKIGDVDTGEIVQTYNSIHL